MQIKQKLQKFKPQFDARAFQQDDLTDVWHVLVITTKWPTVETQVAQW